MRGRCTSKRSLRFWQYQPTGEQIPVWVAVHCTFNKSKSLSEVAQIVITCGGEHWTIDPGDFVIEHPDGSPYVVTEREFHDMFDMVPEVAPA